MKLKARGALAAIRAVKTLAELAKRTRGPPELGGVLETALTEELFESIPGTAAEPEQIGWLKMEVEWPKKIHPARLRSFVRAWNQGLRYGKSDEIYPSES